MDTIHINTDSDYRKLGPEGKLAALFFAMALSLSIFGYVPSLVGAGAVGGYEMANHNNK